LLVAVDQCWAPSWCQPGLYRCNLDGTACTYADISAGQGLCSGEYPSAVIDSANAKILVVTQNGGPGGHKPALFRCNLDGTACSYTDISAGQPADSGYSPSALLDSSSAKLLVVTQNGAAGNKPALFRCNLDGTACSYADISAGQAAECGLTPSAAIDSADAKLLVVTKNGANSNRPALFRCNLDGTACSYADISAGQGPESGWDPSVLTDPANGKLLVIAHNDNNVFKPALFRCNLDGTACSYTDISAGQPPEAGGKASTVIDSANAKLLVAIADNVIYQPNPYLFRCNLDGSECTYTDMSPLGPPNPAWFWSSAVIDSVNGKLRIVTSYALKLAIFSICLR
jgi:hypothetical protein